MKKLWIYSFLVGILSIVFLSDCSTKIKGSGKSESVGEVNNGSLVNGRKFPFSGDNYSYFSRISYAFFNRAWIHEQILKTCLDAYKICEKTCPDHKFLLMECSHKNGGRMYPHRTHQNGTSIDFGTPLIKDGKQFFRDKHYGLFHYIMSFDEDGNYNGKKGVKIDFEIMGKHLLALDEAARKNGMYIKKVILKIDLKDNFFESESGKKIKKKNIYFAQSLPKLVDNQHDEHYHVDFSFL